MNSIQNSVEEVVCNLLKMYIDKDLEELIKTQNKFIVQKKRLKEKI